MRASVGGGLRNRTGGNGGLRIHEFNAVPLEHPAAASSMFDPGFFDPMFFDTESAAAAQSMAHARTGSSRPRAVIGGGPLSKGI